MTLDTSFGPILELHDLSLENIHFLFSNVACTA